MITSTTDFLPPKVRQLWWLSRELPPPKTRKSFVTRMTTISHLQVNMKAFAAILWYKSAKLQREIREWCSSICEGNWREVLVCQECILKARPPSLPLLFFLLQYAYVVCNASHLFGLPAFVLDVGNEAKYGSTNLICSQVLLKYLENAKILRQ